MKYTFSHALTEWLEYQKIDYFFGVPGTESSALLSALGQVDRTIKPITTIHEFITVSMAHGAYLASKKPQFVLLHSTVGIGNAMGGIINASRMNIPLLIVSGKSPSFEYGADHCKDRYIHWGQDSKDYSSLLREYVKYSYELKDAKELIPIFSRALSIAMTPPMGPVHISVPKEILMAEVTENLNFESRISPATMPFPDDEQLEAIAKKIRCASFPIIITNQSGREKGSFEALTSFSKEFSIPVITNKPIYSNFKACEHNIVDPDNFSWMENADIIISLDTDVPWYPVAKLSTKGKLFIQVGADPLYTDYPVRSFASDYTITSMIVPFLEKLSSLLATELDDNRCDQWKEKTLELKEKNINVHYEHSELSQTIAATLDEDTVLFNEYKLPPKKDFFQHPGSYFRIGPASCLGWAFPASLGYKLYKPTKNVIVCTGDGSYLFSQPHICHWIAKKYNLSFLYLILNNAGMGSISKQVIDDFECDTPNKSRETPLCDFKPSFALIDMAKSYNCTTMNICEDSKGFESLEKAILEFKKNKKQVLIDLKTS